MTRAEVRGLLVTLLLLAASGIVLGICKRLLPNDDPFSAVASPWEPWALRVHVLAAPIFLFLFGLIFRRHVGGRIRDVAGRGRRSGGLTVALISSVAATGYVFEVVTADRLRNLLSLSHLGLGMLLALVYLLHARLKAVEPELEGVRAGRARGKRVAAPRKAGHDR